MISTIEYIEEWQEALELEIEHLKKFGSTKYQILNGNQVSNADPVTYYAECTSANRIPVGATGKLEWGHQKYTIRILSSDQNSLLFSMDRSIGEYLDEGYIYQDPWELLEQLIDRLDEIRKSKKKRSRIKKLMEPSEIDQRPDKNSKSNVQELFARSKYNPVTFVWGPPGTGKTYTLARTAANKYFKDKKILVLSHSNQAVDVLLTEITAFVKRKSRFREGDILRYGSQTGERLLLHGDILSNQLLEKQDPKLVKEKEQLAEEKKLLKQDLFKSFSKRDSNQLLDIEKKLGRLIEKIRQKEIELTKEAFIIGTTLARAAMDPALYEQDFDLVIVDEASMAYIPQIAFAGTLGKRFVVCGDFKQLPPIASAKDPLVERWLREDIFHRAGVADIATGGMLHPQLFLLREQRRMHPEISAFTNKQVYNSLVGDHESVKEIRNEMVTKGPFPKRASILLDTSYTGEYCFNGSSSGSRMNIMNVLLSFQSIHEAYTNGFRSIGYVTPYRAQASLMEQLLQDLYERQCTNGDILASTVHRFQGSERDLMVFDTVDSYPFNRPGMLLTGKDSDRLLNVALTRTKGKLIHISDAQFLKERSPRSKMVNRLISYQEDHNQTIRMDQIGRWVEHQHPRLQWSYARNLDTLLNDIKEARRSIIASLPNDVALPEGFVQKLITRNPRAMLTLYSKEHFPYLDPDLHIKDGPAFSFIMMDHKVLWIGIPIEANRRLRPPYVAARLESEAFCNLLIQQMPKG